MKNGEVSLIIIMVGFLIISFLYTFKLVKKSKGSPSYKNAFIQSVISAIDFGILLILGYAFSKEEYNLLSAHTLVDFGINTFFVLDIYVFCFYRVYVLCY